MMSHSLNNPESPASQPDAKEAGRQAVGSIKWLEVWGNSYPILKELEHGWFLVAHPNGPAIARAENWRYLGHLAHFPVGSEPDCVPSMIRYDAVNALMQWAANQPTWPKAA